MEKHLDVTIDFETTALTVNAAVMQVAIVPWFRDSDKKDQFINNKSTFVRYVDLRSCVVDGFDFDQNTINWWAKQSKEVKSFITDGLPEPIGSVTISIADYLHSFLNTGEVDSICIWSQGSDFDLALLRNLCHKYDIDLERIVPHTSFRDSRTIILESALVNCEELQSFHKEGVKVITCADLMRNPSLAYELFEPLPEECGKGREIHDAFYDAIRSSWYTWQALKWLCK